MTIDALRLHSLQMPLVRPFRTSFGTQHVRDVMLVEAIDSDGVQGWGECVTLGWPGYNAEYTAGAIRVIKGTSHRLFWARGLDSRRRSCRHEGGAWAPHLPGRPGTAVLDVGYVAPLPRSVTTSGDACGSRLRCERGDSHIGKHRGTLLEEVGMYVDAGYRRIKLKIEPGWDIEPVAAVRERWPTIPLQVDANQAYSREHAHHLARLDEFDLLLIEQPLEEEDWWGHTLIARACSTPICLDESILSTESAETAIEFGAASNINIKPGRVAGFLEAKKIHDLCLSREVPVWCGGMLETGIGRAANVALAALPGFTLPGDTSASNRYYAEDVTEPFVLRDGRLAVPTGPGIGVVPIPENLRSMSVAVEELTRP